MPLFATFSVKRAVDLLGALLLLLLGAPLLPAAAAAVALTSRGPVLVGSVRAGLADRPFTMLAFRTAPATRTGRLLRRRFLDRLPQLINVVRGEMSLVGPRPVTLARAASAVGAERARAAVRPGMTGLWQTSGRSGLPWEEAAVLDLHYVQEYWLGLDLLILARTGRMALRGRTPEVRTRRGAACGARTREGAARGARTRGGAARTA
ncbi:sugar transferase [Streptomyces katsurahamanus]|uniref:Sugar transferase n=1 Tax=Streptomyces katsurahamanus TaxID=2577098 RepID=A0ABW9P0K0_9ACTN|nr:sugar transferase [Streptomyces katsurahamanus]MQS39055.1 sugar transferase [Streptomyces katsurahamanus]